MTMIRKIRRRRTLVLTLLICDKIGNVYTCVEMYVFNFHVLIFNECGFIVVICIFEAHTYNTCVGRKFISKQEKLHLRLAEVTSGLQNFVQHIHTSLDGE